MISFILLKNQTYIIMQMTILFLTVTLTFLKPRMSSHPKVNMLLSGLVQTRCRPILESSRQLSWVREGTVTVRASQYMIILLNVKTQSSYWWVTIDYMLNFDLHISDICKKAARQINVLCRPSRYLSTETKLLIYKSFVRSNFSYCPLVWHFCSKSSTDKMEKLQYRALRLVYSDFISSYEDLLKRQI